MTPDQQKYIELADSCDELAALLRETSRYDLVAWKWITSNKAKEVVDLISVLRIEELGDTHNE